MTSNFAGAPRSGRWRAALAVMLLCASSFTPAIADDGHNHGNEAPAAEAAASPRFEAHSDLFELVGIADKGQLTIYLDRHATNEPVTGARIEFESGEAKGVATPQPDGTYLVKIAALSKPGDVPFSFTVTAGSEADLLAGELELKDPHDHHDEEGKPWARWGGFGAAALLALGIAALAARKLLARRAIRELK